MKLSKKYNSTVALAIEVFTHLLGLLIITGAIFIFLAGMIYALVIIL